MLGITPVKLEQEKLVFKIQVEGREGLSAVCPWLACLFH